MSSRTPGFGQSLWPPTLMGLKADRDNSLVGRAGGGEGWIYQRGGTICYKQDQFFWMFKSDRHTHRHAHIYVHAHSH